MIYWNLDVPPKPWFDLEAFYLMKLRRMDVLEAIQYLDKPFHTLMFHSTKQRYIEVHSSKDWIEAIEFGEVK
jgi:hypothetical protein